MVSSAIYDPSTGNKNSSTNAFGQTDTYLYVTWGRLVNTTNYLNINVQRNYQREGYNFMVTENDDEGHSLITIINPLGQTIETRNKDIEGNYIGKAAQFDVYGRPTASSQAAQPYSYSQWNSTAYDEYGRIKQNTSYSGKVTNISYSGLSVTANDGVKSSTDTKNVFGQVASHQDGGGTINYTYFANGNLKTADYAGISQIFEQDGWGNKTKLIDPSAGTYQYEYDGWGQLTKEITPKGVTEFTFDATGKLVQKKITGDDTNMQYGYSYDLTSKQLTSMTLTNADGNNAAYNYYYDSNKRLTSSIEDNLHARFVKSYTYDSFGRVSTEGYEAKDKLTNITVQKTIEMQYQYGELLQTSLQGTGPVIWKLNTLDNKGQISTSLNGTSLKTTFQYDTYGLPQSITVDRISGGTATLMNLGYSFDAQRGLLNSRSNSAFGWSENFSYDNLDRLTNFNDNLGISSQSYDARGRIQNNSQVGDYTYENGSYKQTELDLSNNPTANTYYELNHPLQQISFNAFKSPVEIYEQGKERISFQYNAALGRSHMYYGDDQVDKLFRPFRRHYSEDGSMEITNDLLTGKTSFVFYLGGDAYNAPAIWKEVIGSSTTTQNLYYLHRDHLGSIVMITDDLGVVVEKRQFDAWGNIVQLTDGNNTPLTAFSILDRGFTGHEHLLSVGLINMNGRLYDPKLHRFLSPDNFVQEPNNTQNYNRYGYAMNNPLMYTDPNGEFLFAFLIPIIGKVAAAIIGGAIVGAAIGATTYTVASLITGNFTWGGFWKSAAVGAVSGAISGGLSSIGSAGTTAANATASSFWQSTTWGLLRSATSQFATDIVFGNKITWGGVAGSVAGGFLSTRLPSWKAVSGNWFGNAAGELVHNTARGGISGLVSGGVSAAVDGRNIKDGALLGLRNGALGGASQSLAMIATFGATYKPKVDGLKIPEGVVFRKGGIYQLLIDREVTWGNNIITNGNTAASTYKHELQHYTQYLKQGWAIFQGRGIYEQFINTVFGVDVYSHYLYGRRYQESDAQWVEDH